ncbi:MAG: 3-deoxy-D-manno-octulosonic acid transferase [Sedimentisphaerales bacterium]|nr:3-deoxy-D-manno-octulosonic acid transferase [Sedimentisphaerales bacterium]
MTFIIDCVYLLIGVAISPVVLYRVARHKRYHSGWAQRFGEITRKKPEEKCIWIHAVSVGEVNATKTIVEELEKRFGDYEIVISTTTDTGFARASSLFGSSHTVTYFPFDFSPVMHRAFRAIRPAICLLMELEVWPNLVRIAEQQNVPVVVVNGRISERSFSGYKKIKPIAEKTFGRVSLILAQTEEYARRFRQVGAAEEKVIVTGSLKYDTAQITDKVEGTDELAEQLFGKIENPLWVAGGTGSDEEKILLDVYRNLKQRFKDLRLAIVPRKPERFDEVAELIRQSGFDLIRYSEIKNDASKSKIENRKSKIDAVILGDTMGDLRKFYSLASVIFVGRTLVPLGGSDMIEAAALGKCTIFGPSTHNFQQTADALLAAQGSIMVKDKQELLQAMEKCLSEPDFAEKIARNGQEVIKKNQGATAKTINQIAAFLNG